MLRIKQHFGVTLVELMISLTLGLVVLLGVLQIFSSGQQAYNENRRFAELQAEITLLQDLLNSDIRAAQSVTIVKTNDDFTLTLNYPAPSTPSVITYQFDAGLPSGTLARNGEVISEMVTVTNLECLTSSEAVVTCGVNAMQVRINFALVPAIGAPLQFTLAVALRNNVLLSKFS